MAKVEGLILGFDLDQTLIDSHGLTDADLVDYPTAKQFIKTHINNTILDTILRPALELRRLGYVNAIVLLTNNNGRDYVSYVCKYIADHLSGAGIFKRIRDTPSGNSEMSKIAGVNSYFFDYVMVRQHASRSKIPDPTKSLADIKYMIDAINEYRSSEGLNLIKTNDLQSRTYFFDDREHHIIRDEIGENYIQITGPDYYPYPNNKINKGFVQGKADTTYYTPILLVLRNYFRQHDEARMAARAKALNEQKAQLAEIRGDYDRRIKALQKPTATSSAPVSTIVPPQNVKSVTDTIPSFSRLPAHLQAYSLTGATAKPSPTQRISAYATSTPPLISPGSLASLRKPLTTTKNAKIGSILSSGFGGRKITRKRSSKKRKYTYKRR
jgi:hypothetical protein